VKGSYVLLLWIDKDRKIKFGKNHNAYFKEGIYAYVGSALNNLYKRLNRHFTYRKKLRWHIDYIIPYSKILGAIVIESPEKLESIIANHLALYYEYIPKFGATDTNDPSHLFYIGKSYDALFDYIYELKDKHSIMKIFWIVNPKNNLGAAGGI